MVQSIDRYDQINLFQKMSFLLSKFNEELPELLIASKRLCSQ